MTIEFIANQWVYATGWTLIHSLWQGAVVWSVVQLILRLRGGQSASFRYLGQMMALLLIPLASVFTFIDALERYQQTSHWLESGLTIPFANFAQSSLAVLVNNSLDEIVLLWLAGVLLLLLRLAGSLVFCRHVIASRSLPLPPELQRLMDGLRHQLGVVRQVRFLLSPVISVPCVVGHLKPVILLPASLILNLDRQQLEAIVLHELAHIRRHDFLVNLIQAVLQNLYFFNPFVRLLVKNLDTERENICDDIAVAHCGDAMVYARTLERFSSLLLAEGAAVALAGTGGSMLDRIRRQLEPGGREHGNSGRLPAALALAALMLVFAVQAVGAQGQSRYEGITSITPQQVDSIIEDLAKVTMTPEGAERSLRVDGSQVEGVIASLRPAEKLKLKTYLTDALKQKYDLDNWSMHLQDGTPQDVISEEREVIFDDTVMSRVWHLFWGGSQLLDVLTVDGDSLLKLYRYNNYDAWDIETQGLLEYVQQHPGLLVSSKYVAARFQPGEGFIILLNFQGGDIDWESIAADNFEENHKTSRGRPFDNNVAAEDIQRQRNVTIGYSETKYSGRLLVSMDAVDELGKQTLSHMGDGYLGLSAVADKLAFAVAPESLWKSSEIMARIHMQYGSSMAPEDFDASNNSLEQRLALLTEEQRSWLMTENEMQDFAQGLGVDRGWEISSGQAQEMYFTMLNRDIDSILANDEKRIEGLKVRPWYSSGENHHFVAFLHWPAPETGEAFQLDLRDEPLSTVYDEFVSHCSHLNLNPEARQMSDRVTVFYKNLNCERLQEVVGRIESTMLPVEQGNES